MALNISDFDYELPAQAIALRPLAERTESRLLCVGRDDGALSDQRFPALLDRLAPGDLLVMNNTRVLPARLYTTKPTGGRVEVFLERLLDSDTCLAQIGASKPTRPGQVLRTDAGSSLEVCARDGKFHRLRLIQPAPPAVQGAHPQSLLEVFENEGHMPLPPYIPRADEPADRTRYQTVFAKEHGAVAAPTAGLHFDSALLEAIRAHGVEIEHVTLHVGAGTFLPVRSESLRDHEMHAERVRVGPELCEAVARTRARGGRVVAVGTTVMRALESAALAKAGVAAPDFRWPGWDANIDPDQRAATRPAEMAPYAGETRLFITPGYTFGVVDALVTNFHQPRSTLLVLVSAFAGRPNILAAYRHAVREGYRFLSYGDAMWLA